MKTQINVLKAFTFTYPVGAERAGEKEEFAPGLAMIDEEFVGHFFVKAHCGDLTDGSATLNEQLQQAGEMVLALHNSLDAANDELRAALNENADLRKELVAAQEDASGLQGMLTTAEQRATEVEAAMTTLAQANSDLTKQLADAAAAKPKK